MDVKALTMALKEEIKNYHHSLDREEIGMVLSVSDNVAQVYGLDKVMLGEMVVFEHGERGLVLNLEEKSVGIAILDEGNLIKENQIVKRSHKVLEVAVGESLLSRVVDPLAKPLDYSKEIKAEAYYPLEKIAPLVMERKSVDEALETGILAIDTLTPIGKGQRELLIGDRQTGKSSIAIDTVINQKGKNVKCIYVCIGQKNSTVAQLVDRLTKAGAMEYTIVISASASESVAMQYIAPYAGCAMGEYFMDKGEDVLIVYDDLSKHAVSYRTLSLLLKRSPGREAYPGDVFYLHSRLLERSARLEKGGSLTALPIIETQEGDISSYIPTNVISITDGQIFLQTDLFNEGIRPAIDSGLSVSRVGSKAQIKAVKQVSSSLKISLSNYKELESFSKFGSDLDSHTKEVLDNGRKVVELLKQNEGESYSFVEETILIFGIKYELYHDIKVSQMLEFKKYLLDKMNLNYNSLILEIQKKQELDKKIEEKLTSAIEKIVSDFKAKGN